MVDLAIMANKLSKLLRDIRKGARRAPLPMGYIEEGPERIGAYRNPFTSEKELRAPARREIYKRELQSLAKHRLRPEDKTITFAHPLQSFSSKKGYPRVKGAIGGENMEALGGHSLIESHPIGPFTLSKSNKGLAIRELTKARRYSKLLKKVKAKGALGLALTAVSAFSQIGSKE